MERLVNTGFFAALHYAGDPKINAGIEMGWRTYNHAYLKSVTTMFYTQLSIQCLFANRKKDS